MNPDLDRERRKLVTPVLRWMAAWGLAYGGYVKWVVRAVVGFAMVGVVGVVLWQGSLAGAKASMGDGDGDGNGEGEDDEADGGKAKKKKDSKDEEEKSNK
jgi:hypothetical protein